MMQRGHGIGLTQALLISVVVVTHKQKTLLYWHTIIANVEIVTHVKNTFGAEPLTPADLMTHVTV
jgi:hypothetical protein